MRLLPNVIKASQYAGIDGTVTIISSASARVNEAEVRRKQLLHEAAEEAKKILENAQIYSAALIRDSEKRIEEERSKVRRKSEEEGYHKGFEKGCSEGYENGYNNGIREARDSQQQAVNKMEELFAKMEAQKDEILERFSSDIQKLAFEIAEKVIHMEINKDDKALSSIISNATEAYRNQEWVKLTIPKDMEKWLAGEDNEIFNALREVSDNVKVVTSADMVAGGCLIDMPEQLIDAGTDTQLSRIKTALQL